MQGVDTVADWVRVASTSDLPIGRSLCVTVNGHKVALFNVDGAYYAIDDRCSHAEASLSEGDIDGDVVICPRHGARFDIRSGRALSLPAWTPVATWPVKVEGDAIYIALRPS